MLAAFFPTPIPRFVAPFRILARSCQELVRAEARISKIRSTGTASLPCASC